MMKLGTYKYATRSDHLQIGTIGSNQARLGRRLNHHQEARNEFSLATGGLQIST